MKKLVVVLGIIIVLVTLAAIVLTRMPAPTPASAPTAAGENVLVVATEPRVATVQATVFNVPLQPDSAPTTADIVFVTALATASEDTPIITRDLETLIPEVRKMMMGFTRNQLHDPRTWDAAKTELMNRYNGKKGRLVLLSIYIRNLR